MYIYMWYRTACFTRSFGRPIYCRRQVVRLIADKITYLKLIFIKHKAAVRCSHDCLAFTRRAVVRCACKVARLSQVRPRNNRANFMSCLTVRSALAAAVQLHASSFHGFRATVLRHLRAKYVSASSCVRCTRALRLLKQPCSCLACLVAAMRPYKITRESQGK